MDENAYCNSVSHIETARYLFISTKHYQSKVTVTHQENKKKWRKSLSKQKPIERQDFYP